MRKLRRVLTRGSESQSQCDQRNLPRRNTTLRSQWCNLNRTTGVLLNHTSSRFHTVVGLSRPNSVILRLTTKKRILLSSWVSLREQFPIYFLANTRKFVVVAGSVVYMQCRFLEGCVKTKNRKEPS